MKYKASPLAWVNLFLGIFFIFFISSSFSPTPFNLLSFMAGMMVTVFIAEKIGGAGNHNH